MGKPAAPLVPTTRTPFPTLHSAGQAFRIAISR
jgi:hypothetical protein